MNRYYSPTLLDPALFWGVALVIYFCFHKSRKGKKEKGGCAKWQNLSSNGHDLFSFFLRGFYENKPSNPAFRQKTIDHQKPTPAPLRVFAPPREPISLPAVRGCLFLVSRGDAETRRRGFERLAKPHQTRPLPEECVVSAPIIRDPQRRLGSSLYTYSAHANRLKTGPRTCARDHGDGEGEDCAQLGDLGDLCAAGIPWVTHLLSEESPVFEAH
jgi:hypothetical protein